MHLATGVVRGLPAHQPLLGGASCARVAPPRAQFEEDEEYLADLEQELTRASSRKSLFDSGQRRNSLAASLGRRSAAAAGTQDQRRRQSRIRLTRQNTQLAQLLPTARAMYNDFLERPGQPLVLGSLALLVGFYLAGSLSTIFGAKGFWEPVIALGPLLVSERVTQEYFTRLPHERSPTLKLLNALKNGFYLGIVLDALKLAG